MYLPNPKWVKVEHEIEHGLRTLPKPVSYARGVGWIRFADLHTVKIIDTGTIQTNAHMVTLTKHVPN